VGSNYACTAALTDFTIAPGDSLHGVRQLVAVRFGLKLTDLVFMLAAGTYRIRTHMNAALPDLEMRVVVTAAAVAGASPVVAGGPRHGAPPAVVPAPVAR